MKIIVFPKMYSLIIISGIHSTLQIFVFIKPKCWNFNFQIVEPMDRPIKTESFRIRKENYTVWRHTISTCLRFEVGVCSETLTYDRLRTQAAPNQVPSPRWACGTLPVRKAFRSPALCLPLPQETCKDGRSSRGTQAEIHPNENKNWN